MTTPGGAILVWLETEGRGLGEASKRLALIASDLAKQGQLTVHGAIMAGAYGPPPLGAFAGLGLTGVLAFKGRHRPTVGERAAALLQAAKLLSPDILLVASDERGREMAPMVAARLETGLTADCVSLRLENGLMVQTRPAFGGDLIAEIITPIARPQMATVRVSGAQPVKANGEREPRPPWRGHGPGHEPGLADPTLPTLEVLLAPPVMGEPTVLKRTPLSADDDLEKASVVIACGLGLGGPEGVSKAKNLADKLGASLGATRAAVDRGWLPGHRQIGLSGRAVSPNLLITLGVSGSVQFMAGAGGAKDIIAVNADPRAPILALARVGLIIEMENLWPELEDRLGPL
ncbi:MAG: FAD-binding protein [Deltaproteobacteria bacterium]|jgi:electron transfer flavoprotein alpha subunit|nr:FAD-binding protein [Deltaproteobacteria bacterium]